ncbi:MAG: acyl-CoA thioesterase [Kiritimatiellae bacterium]|nr:acyl-CoA thioesterase [Kiritimatiellia bacterium]
MLPYHYEHHVRVRYAETDQMGVCWHGNYLLYLEEARGEALRATGNGSYADMEAAGVMTPIVNVNLNYHRSAFYDEVLTIHVYVEEPVRSRIKFRYEVVNPAGELVLDGTTTLAFITSDSHQPCRPPLAMRQFFK